MNRSFVLFIAAMISFLMISCSRSENSTFQTNDKAAQFSLFHLFDGYPALKAAWDSVPGNTGNKKLTEMLKDDIDTGAEFMSIVSYLLETADDPGLGLLDDLKAAVGLVNSTDQRLYGHSSDNTSAGNPVDSYYYEDQPAAMVNNFYSLLDEITTDVGGTTPKMSSSVLAISRKIIDYVLTKSDADIEDTMNDLIADVKDPDFKNDFTDLMKIAAGPLAMGDFSMWIDRKGTDDYAGDDELITDYTAMASGYNSDLGNMSKGAVSFMYGLCNLLSGETVDRVFMYDMIGRMSTAFYDTEMVKRLVWNISNYFTEGGAGYGTKNTATLDATTFANDVYNMDITGQILADSEIKETLRQLLPLSGGLFRRDDRISSMPYNSLMNMGINSQDYPMTWVLNNIDKLYINWDQTQVKESIYDCIRYDAHGRDRKTDPTAYSHGILEHLLFLGSITSNFGYKHLAGTGEVGDGTVLSDPINGNGHGEFTGFLTLNDSLFSAATMGINNWMAIFQDGVLRGELCRSKNFFTADDRANYIFRISWDYPILRCLSGPSAGDLGVNESLNGGNVNGGGGSTTDAYVPFTPNGIGTTDLSTWTFALIARACYEGEGPYYSTQGAQTSGSTYTYYRPDGSIYAAVDKSSGNQSTWAYTYPVDSSVSQDKVDPDPTASGQRWNRFKPTWNTDYYLIRFSNQNYTLTDMTGNATDSACLTFNEIAIPNDQRECASHEEAIFRNFQWVMNEKKMVIILPLNLIGFIPGYEIIEGNGITGLSMARAYRGNALWAKANTGINPDVPDPDNPLAKINTTESIAASLNIESSIPGDYRVIGIASVGGAIVYDSLGRGSLTPAVIGQNIVALSRLAFPRSPFVVSGTNYEHKLLGSRRIDNDSENTDEGFLAWNSAAKPQGDAVWRKRNALIPILFALIDNLRIKSGPTNNAVGKMLAGLDPLIKPLSFFNYDISDDLGVSSGVSGVAKNSWLPRIKGDSVADGQYRYPHSKHLTPDWYVAGFLDPDTGNIITDEDNRRAWYGGNNARDYFSPANKITFLSMLLDADTNENRTDVSQRANGLLAKLTEYTPGASGRPDVTVSAATPDPPNAIDVARVLFGLEQITSGMKMNKSEAIKILERMSVNDSLYAGYKAVKQLDQPEWIFTKREGRNSAGKYADIDLEFIFDNVVGDPAAVPAEGLLKYHDTDGDYSVAGSPDWTDLTNGDDGILDTLTTLTGNFLVEGAPYAISGHLFDILDVMAQHNPTEPQIKGMIYTLAKLLAYYNEESTTHSWLIQGEDGFLPLYDMLANALPNIDTALGLYSTDKGVTKGETYRNLITAMKNTMKVNGFVPWIVDTVSINPYSSGDFLIDLQQWLESDLVSGPNTEFYSTLSRMLGDMGIQVSESPTEEGLEQIYVNYGFQPNF